MIEFRDQIEQLDPSRPLEYIRSKCHPQKTTWTYYNHDTGTLTVECASCRTTIVQFRIPSRNIS